MSTDSSALPNSMPVNIRIRRPSPTSMVVSWSPPPSSPDHPTVTGYLVHYSPINESGEPNSWFTVEVSAESLEAEIEGLDQDSTYAVKVKAVFATIRHGEFSDIVYSIRIDSQFFAARAFHNSRCNCPCMCVFVRRDELEGS